MADQTLALFRAVADLPAEEVAALEETLRVDPKDTSVRARLPGFYSDVDRFWDQSAQERKHKHTLWFIRHAPESELLSWKQEIDPCDDPAPYVEGKRLWMQPLEPEPDNLEFYLHAAEFMSHRDSDLAIELLRQGQHRDESNPEWALRLGQLLLFDIWNPAAREAIDIEAAEQSMAHSTSWLTS